MQVAIDFGLSNTDAVARDKGQLHFWKQTFQGDISREILRGILEAGGIDWPDVSRLKVTGGRSRNLPDKIDHCIIEYVPEATAIGRGGQALLNIDPATDEQPLLVVSAGSGTAIVLARGTEYSHVSGTAVGGGTLLGLSKLLLNTIDPLEIEQLSRAGNSNVADLSIAEALGGAVGHLPESATAVNFGRVARISDEISREDLAAALVTMVGQVIALMAINTAKACQAEKIVVIGHLTDMPSLSAMLTAVGDLYNVRLEIPQPAGHAIALGALLS